LQHLRRDWNASRDEGAVRDSGSEERDGESVMKRPLIVMTHQKGALSLDEVEKIKKEFNNFGIACLVIAYDGLLQPPKFSEFYQPDKES